MATRLGLVNQTDLLHWSDSREAQGYLPRLIRRLILETGRGVVQLGFPGGEGIATGSWDGTVRTTEPTAFIPVDLSLWEVSAENSANAKANKDYVKRLTTPDGARTEDCTYVAVSLRRWSKRLEWAMAKSSDGRWRAVRAYGVDDIETWLESAPITHAWISELLGFHPHGILSAETWWASWSGATLPPFPAAAVLAGRKEEADNLRAKLAGPSQIVTLQGLSKDDVFAFVSALALTDAGVHDAALLSKMAFIDKVEAWRRLREHTTTLALVPMTQAVADDMGASSVHHLIVPITGAGPADIELRPIDSQEASKELSAVGLNEHLANETGKLARLSLLAARRRIALKIELHRPPWAVSPIPRLRRRALLAGRWNERSPADLLIVSNLSGAEYDSLREESESLMAAQDPLLARFGSSIGLVSHFDAWLLLKGSLRKDDIESFKRATDVVFGEIHPALELPPDDRWRASLLGKVRTHSSDLRLGMANSLALLGSHGGSEVEGSGLTGQEWASWIVRVILERANKDETCRLWISLRDVLTLFAEAAPTTFLDAVRDGLQGETPPLPRMFMDSEGSNPLFTDSPHSNLLWALEVCAWSPTDFGQTVDLLARLAEVDPGGRVGNRPMASLADIFRPWYPQNSVSVERRLATLDGLRDRHEWIAWQLMLSMLPEHGGGYATNIAEPRYRDWRPTEISVTRGEHWDQIDGICQRLLKDVGVDVGRWTSILKRLPSFHPQARARLIESLSALSVDASFGEDARDKIWESIRGQVSHHREFQNAGWALPGGDLDQMEEVGARFKPTSPSKQAAWLFDDYRPNIPMVERGSEEYNLTLAQLRVEAAKEIEISLAWPELHRFATSKKMPGLFGATLVQAKITTYDKEMLGLLITGNDLDLQLATGYLSKRFEDESWAWVEKHMNGGNLLPEQYGWLLLATGDFPKAWKIAEAASGEIAKSFWRHFRTYGLGSDFPHVETVALKLLEVGRPGAALELLLLYRGQDREKDRSDLIASSLEGLLRCAPEASDIRSLAHHDLVEAFSYLEPSPISRERLAKLEWAYLAIFDNGTSPPALSLQLAQSPSAFVDAISCVYRPRPPQDDTVEDSQSQLDVKVDEERDAMAMNAYRLLSNWRALPGTREDGSIDGERLKQWVLEARQLLRTARRIDVGDLHIGELLASSPAAPDGSWPCIEVRELLEHLQSSKMEEGLGMRIHNDRGVTTRGMLDGGDQELELAAKYRQQAAPFADRWPRTSAVLRGLAEDYEREARLYEAEAERRRKGFET